MWLYAAKSNNVMALQGDRTTALGEFRKASRAYDIFNPPNFGMPNPDIRQLRAGFITSANRSRNLQLGAS
jgi:hypothetical protein